MSLLSYTILYHSYKHLVAKFIRLVFVFGMFSFIFLGIAQGTIAKGPLFLLSLFLMAEVIYRFKVIKTKPKLSVTKNTLENVYESFTLQALDNFFFAHTASGVIKQLVLADSVQFILKKANISLAELQHGDVTKKEVGEKAYEVVKQLGGSFITRMDLVVAYILLAEPKTKLLFNKQLKTEDLLYILYWARYEFPDEEFPPKSRVVFWGVGIGEDWTTGWTLETEKYITDITYKVLEEKPTLVGRRKEFQEMINILSRPSQNNALLIGETGTGKTSLVDALALNSFLGILPEKKLYHKRVYQLMIGLLIAGIRDMGDLESRIESILQELDHAGNIILFIPDIEHILGSQTFKIDLSGALARHLRDAKLPIVATVTSGAYKQFIAPKDTFADVFEVVQVEEPDRAVAVQMLLEKANEIGEKNNVAITYKAILAAVDLAKRYMQDRSLPGSSVALLNSTASSVSLAHETIVDEKDVVAKVEQQTKVAISKPGQKETSLLLHLEDKMHEKIIGQEEAIKAISTAIRRLRSGITSETRPISFLFLGPTGVGKTETAKALASVYFGGEEKIIRLDMSEYTSPSSIDRLLGAGPGQGDEKGELTDKVHDHPFSLILLDEFEKAHPEVLDLFLQVLEDGRLTDNHGKRVSFANTIIIATSNAGALYIQEQLRSGVRMDTNFQKGLLMQLEHEHIFKPELLNRFDGIIVFKPLGQKEIEKIATLYIKDLQKKLAEQDITVIFDESILATLAKYGFDQEFGARPLRRFLQDSIEDGLAKALLEGKVERGAIIKIRSDEQGNILLSQQK